MCQVKPRKTILSEQLNLLFNECEELMNVITQYLLENKEKLNKL